jgi:UDP-N-acetylglucosamine--N-acetylmuramyl-(pentapeptide) pyrophosphoryl-undecaprenol N-acetylglucosamine transferase
MANSKKQKAKSKFIGGKPVRLVITGGHHTPALAVIEALQRRNGFQFYWIGHRHAFADPGSDSLEYKAVTKMGIPFFDLRAGKLYRISALRELSRVPLGFFHAFYFLLKVRPKLIISFGGYLAAPVVLAGIFLGIPAVTHEQTVVSGWANRFIGWLAKKVFISWKQSKSLFPKGKSVLTGNPLRKAVFEARRKRFRFSEDLPTIYITGGKQGAHIINETVRRSLSELLEKYNIIHQTGSTGEYRDYQRIMVLRSQLPKHLAKRYIVQEFFGENEIGAVYREADIVVGRAGANTVTELAALGKPAILVPIPWASHDEQVKNARFLEKAGLASILSQEKLSPDTLLGVLEKMIADLGSYREKGEEVKKLVDRSAADNIAGEIMRLVA